MTIDLIRRVAKHAVLRALGTSVLLVMPKRNQQGPDRSEQTRQSLMRVGVLVTTILAAAGSAAATGAEDAALAQDLVNVKASDQVMAARWTRHPDSYVLLVALDKSKASTRKPSGIPKAATLNTEQALRLAGLEQRLRDDIAQYRQQLAERPAPAADAAAPGIDRSSFFIGNTIANLRGMDPWPGCDRMLTLVDGRRVVGKPAETPPPPRFQPPSPLNQPYPPTLKESRVEAWLLKADGTQILPTTYSCDAGVASPFKPAVEISYIFAVADSAQAVAAAIRIDGDYYIEKLQPLEPKPAAQ